MDAGTMYANAKALHELLQEARAENNQLVMKLNAEHLVRQNVERENAKLRELLVGAFEDMDAWQKVIAGSNEWGYGKGCLDQLCKLRDAMQELGMRVVV